MWVWFQNGLWLTARFQKGICALHEIKKPCNRNLPQYWEFYFLQYVLCSYLYGWRLSRSKETQQNNCHHCSFHTLFCSEK